MNREQLVAEAMQARENAYAPYSNYRVGAAVLTGDGRVFSGVNVENAVYPLCICAERVAIAKAVSEGARRIVALAVVTANGGTPCGSCRQVIREFGAPETPTLIAKPDGSYRERTLDDLLPESFSAADLGRESE
ncbi:MAG: cytidine deaminase [Chloroflexi bacterium]|nr:MAG: cytidine deaminase [Chloroflexota bacterium]